MKQHRPFLMRACQGFTLIELILVLALLVAMAVLAWPRFDQALVQAEHQAAAEQIQSILWRLRLEAIQTGSPQWFRYSPGTSNYETASLPYDEVMDVDFTALSSRMDETHFDEVDVDIHPTDESVELDSDGSYQPEIQGRERMQLENGVVFLSSDARQRIDITNLDRLSETRDLDLDEAIRVEEGLLAEESFPQKTTGNPWSEPIVFYPDGQADHAQIMIQAPSGHTIEVTVSGMAGHVQIGSRQRPAQNNSQVLESVMDTMESSLDAEESSLNYSTVVEP
ncbi:MAG: prepilin-type N-terminal cleavage/methylation domain-containing protein [Pirellulales bacterium]|nr:prepilin-type N-terminal cleavage/methylation domain-containing protein [Pirellulales bacterium]